MLNMVCAENTVEGNYLALFCRLPPSELNAVVGEDRIDGVVGAAIRVPERSRVIGKIFEALKRVSKAAYPYRS